MNQRIGVFTADDARKVLSTTRYLRESGFAIPAANKDPYIGTQEAAIYVKNESGETIPPWACMETLGATDSVGQNYIRVTKPTANAKAYLFNGPASIPAGKTGSAQSGPVLRVFANSTPPAHGTNVRPTTAQWYMSTGGGDYTAIGPDDIGANVFRVVLIPRGTTETIDVVTGFEIVGQTVRYRTKRILASTVSDLGLTTLIQLTCQ